MRDVVFAMEQLRQGGTCRGKKLISSKPGRAEEVHTERAGVRVAENVVLSGETFNETGSIDYSGYGKVTFETVGSGTWDRVPSLDSSGGRSSGALPPGTARLPGRQAISPRILPSPLRVRSWTITTSEWCFPKQTPRRLVSSEVAA